MKIIQHDNKQPWFITKETILGSSFTKSTCTDDSYIFSSIQARALDFEFYCQQVKHNLRAIGRRKLVRKSPPSSDHFTVEACSKESLIKFHIMLFMFHFHRKLGLIAVVAPLLLLLVDVLD